MSDHAPTVFTPLKVGDIELKARIAMAPLTRTRATDDHIPKDVAAEYYAQRASYPGTLLITEATFIKEQAQGWANVPGCYNAEQIAGWKKIVDAVHAKGSYIYLQLWALGRAAIEKDLKFDNPDFEVVSASDEAFEGGARPRPLTVPEIQEYVKWYAACAKAFVQEAGGDGVEIHGAHGYLIDQFFQTVSNKRTDQYGGSLKNRARFGLEVVDAVCAAVGAKKTGIRLSPFATFQGQGMPEPDRTETFQYIASEIKRRHPDFAYLHVVEPRVSGADDRKVNDGESLDFLTKVWSPKPLLVAGGHKLEDAEATAKKYENSVVVFGRYFIANPDLVARVKHGVEFTPYNRATFNQHRYSGLRCVPSFVLITHCGRSPKRRTRSRRLPLRQCQQGAHIARRDRSSKLAHSPPVVGRAALGYFAGARSRWRRAGTRLVGSYVLPGPHCY